MGYFSSYFVLFVCAVNWRKSASTEIEILLQEIFNDVIVVWKKPNFSVDLFQTAPVPDSAPRPCHFPFLWSSWHVVLILPLPSKHGWSSAWRNCSPFSCISALPRGTSRVTPNLRGSCVYCRSEVSTLSLYLTVPWLPPHCLLCLLQCLWSVQPRGLNPNDPCLFTQHSVCGSVCVRVTISTVPLSQH